MCPSPHVPGEGRNRFRRHIARGTWPRSGALDTDLLARRQVYGTDFTKPLPFMADGQYCASLAQPRHLTGDQRGVMNETGGYPGQPGRAVLGGP